MSVKMATAKMPEGHTATYPVIVCDGTECSGGTGHEGLHEADDTVGHGWLMVTSYTRSPDGIPWSVEEHYCSLDCQHAGVTRPDRKTFIASRVLAKDLGIPSAHVDEWIEQARNDPDETHHHTLARHGLAVTAE